MAGVPDSLEEANHSTGRMDQHYRVHGANVNPQLQAGAADDDTQAPLFEPAFHSPPPQSGQGRMMDRDLLDPGRITTAQGPDQALGQAAHVGENQRGAIPL